MKNKGLLSIPLAALTLFGVLTSIFLSRGLHAQVAKADVAKEFPGETELLGGDLTVTAVSSAATEYGASYDIKFSTGGDAVIDNKNLVCILGNNDDLMDFNAELKDMTAEQRTALREEVAEGKRETLQYEGYIAEIEDKPKIVIPRDVSRGEFGYDAIYTVTYDSIDSDVIPSGSNLESLYIPVQITNIAADAFKKATKLTNIYLESGVIPEGFEDGWSGDATVTTGVKFDSKVFTKDYPEHAQTITTKEVGDEDINFILGYWPELGEAIPLTVEYKVKGDDNPRYLELQKTSTYQDFDSVGKKIIAFSNTLTASIDVEKGEEILFESIVIHNILRAKSEKVGETVIWMPVEGEKYYTKPEKMFDRVYHVGDFLEIDYQGINTFAGYTAVAVKLGQTANGIVYKDLKPSLYASYKDDIEAGTKYIRYRFTSLGTSYYRIAYGDHDVRVKVVTPVIQFILNKNRVTNVSFLVKDSEIPFDFNPKDIKSFAMSNVTLTLDVVNTGGLPISRTATSTRFGTIYFMTNEDQNKQFNINLFLILFAAIYSAAAIALATVLFFVFKNIYKNDEFRRLKPKSFIKKSIIYWLTSLVVVLDIVFIVLRATALHNSIVVYNPIDVFIIIASLASVIIIGYYIKNLVVSAKANKQRKKALKLGLANDVADDGTK